jgi:hypothetical protein
MARIKLAADFKDFLSLCLCHRARLFLICSLAFPFLTSCVTKPSGSDACLCHDYFATKQTRQQGVSDAKRDIRDKGFRILRYDLPPVLCGGWYQHTLYFQHFGIEKADELFASLDYCQGYNQEMDRQLNERYGAEYRRFREKILPKPGAKRHTRSR